MVNANKSNLENGVGIPQSEIRNPQSSAPQSNILVVDDDDNSRRLLETILGADGYAARSAASGEEALAAVAAQLPDLILLDIMLPGMDGFEVTRRLKADATSRAVPIILVTSLDDRKSRIKGLEAGAEEFINKPVDRAELLVRVRNLLRLKAYSDFIANHNRILEEQVRERTAALQESEERYQYLFESMDSGVAIYQPDAACEVFTFKSVNRAVERIEQMKREEILGRNVEDVFPGVRAFGLLAVFQRVCRSGVPEHFPAALYQNGQLSGWRENYVYRLNSGEVVAVYDDVTERKQAEAQLNEQLDELRRWHKATMGMGMRNIELKHEVNELLGQTGQPPRYPSAE